MVNRPLGNGYTDITDTYTYTYDTAGNILSETKTSGGTTTSKTYAYSNSNWRDLLTAVNGTAISYDSNGDLKTYYNGNKTYTNLTWQHGRQLTSITVDGATASYAYDMDGIRTQKLVDGVIHSYVTQNGKLVRESFPYGDTTIIMDFIYDEAGRPFCVSYSKNGGESYTNYFYAVNAQGDVEGIFRVIKNDETGKYEQKWYGRYVYDAWGNVTATTAAGGKPSATSLVVRNPLRYRGYYYDNETGFYYLQSRYYDPVTHRFINADSYATTDATDAISCNMFAYCTNNAVNLVDPKGDDPWWMLDDWGYIHRKVQDHIIASAALCGRFLLKEVGITLADGSSGRADLYDPFNNRIWEVKSSGPASLEAAAQLERYCAGTVKGTKISPKVGEQRFYGIFDDGLFRVVYWTTEPGIILYKFWRKEPAEHVAEVFILAGLCPMPQIKKSTFDLVQDKM